MKVLLHFIFNFGLPVPPFTVSSLLPVPHREGRNRDTKIKYEVLKYENSMTDQEPSTFKITKRTV